MLHNTNLSDIYFLDVETVSLRPHFEDLSEREQMLWDKKSIYWRKEDTPGKAYERAGIYAEFGKIICISVGIIVKDKLHIKSFYSNNEKELLEDFALSLDKFSKKRTIKLCAHNGKEFDFPYICRRMLINEIQLPKILQVQMKKPWEVPFIDTLELWRFGDYKNYTSLDLLCEVFNIPTPKENLDGAQVGNTYWVENNMNKIITYCESDVVALVQLFLKISGQLLISEDNIILDRE